MHRESSPGKEIGAAFAFLIFFGLLGYMIFSWPQQVREGARAYLETRYASVQTMERDDRLFGRLCSAGKNRQTFHFTALNHSGQTVRGYLCYTGDSSWLADPAIVEQSVQ